MKNETGSVWHPEWEEKARILRQEGYSARAAARMLNDQFGLSLTRNAVLGKWCRMGLAEPALGKTHAPLPRLGAIGARFTSCQWPVGDVGCADFHFCHASVVPGKPYCLTHCRRAYQKSPSSDGSGGG